jgi:hypothetical protein|tara:strand:+ start:269 stop:469 length:201 start_codon:yes stop_codon:yes gene_type:complete
VSAWKKELEEHMTEIFERKNAVGEAVQSRKNSPHDLSAKWGYSSSRRNFLKKSAIGWGSISAKGHD